MGKLISLINITADGFCDSQYVIADAEFHDFVHGLLDNTQTVVFGRNTFEFFQQVWPPVLEKENQPESQVRMAQALNDIDKIAFSVTLDNTTWHNSYIMKKFDADEINAFKKSFDKNMLIIGSPGLVSSMTKMNLVDEYYFSVQPTIAGSGKVRLFDNSNLDKRQPLKFIGTKLLRSGVVINNYQKAD
jgi:dihydrofolate reductase